jgi:hypothetical protein
MSVAAMRAACVRSLDSTVSCALAQPRIFWPSQEFNSYKVILPV